MAAGDIAFDTMEQILVRSHAEDVIRCKSVCKSWYSLISSPYFVGSHLKHAYNNRKLNKRIIGIGRNFSFFSQNILFMVGSSNGLVCVSPEGLQLLVVNPCTRQTMKILEPPPEPHLRSDMRGHMVWGFGHDSSNNDYKIVVGLVTKRPRQRTRFYVFSLKTCVWKFIEEIDHVPNNGNNISGILSAGALHWHGKHAILSFNLSREEFTKTQLPADGDDHCYDLLGVMEDQCLCIYKTPLLRATKIWVLRSDAWVLLQHNYVMSYKTIYLMDEDDYSIDDTPQILCNAVTFIGAPMYVPSLVSPHVNIIDSCSKSISNDVVISS